MSLSPEEKRRIYEEEKIRQQARKKNAPMGCLIIAGLLLVLWIVANYQASTKPSGAGSSGVTQPTPADSAAQHARWLTCKEKLEKAKEADLLYDIDISRVPPRVIVGPTFYEIPFDAKESFVHTVNCFLMRGDTSQRMMFDLIDSRTNKVVAHWGVTGLKMK